MTAIQTQPRRVPRAMTEMQAGPHKLSRVVNLKLPKKYLYRNYIANVCVCIPQRSTLLKQMIYNIKKKAMENSSNVHDKFNTKKSFC